MRRLDVAAEGGYARARRRLAEELSKSGVRDPRVLDAMVSVPRHLLLPEAMRDRSYAADAALPIGEGQTISAPVVVATMTQALALKGGETVLEIGTGSGYQTAVLAALAGQVVSIERIPRLAARARSALDKMGVLNAIVHLGDGSAGRPADAPFDAILVTAGAPSVPRPLLDQLAVGGYLVGPFGSRESQSLLRFCRKEDGSFVREVIGRCKFVDLIGEWGWAA